MMMMMMMMKKKKKKRKGRRRRRRGEKKEHTHPVSTSASQNSPLSNGKEYTPSHSSTSSLPIDPWRGNPVEGSSVAA